MACALSSITSVPYFPSGTLTETLGELGIYQSFIVEVMIMLANKFQQCFTEKLLMIHAMAALLKMTNNQKQANLDLLILSYLQK